MSAQSQPTVAKPTSRACSSVLFVGGVRSGKSAHALRWAEACAPTRFFIATCRANDQEMRARIAKHQQERDSSWRVIEEPCDLAPVLEKLGSQFTGDAVLLLDCLSSWIANLMEDGISDTAIYQRAEVLSAFVRTSSMPIGIVSLEVGLGIVPMHELARRYCDVLGMCNQILAQACTNVVFYSCGLPLVLKGSLPSELVGCYFSS